MIDFIGNLFSAEAAFKDGAEAIDANTKSIERNKEALIDLQNQVDAMIVKELEMDGVLNDLDLARDAAYKAYQKNLDDIQKLREQAADDQIKAAAQSISDEEDRVEFLAKLGREEVAGVVAITMKKGITRRDFSDEELKLLQSTNTKLFGLQIQYDRAEEKAAELLNQTLALSKKEFDKKAAEQERKVREKRQKALEDLYKDEARIIALTNKLKADAVEDDYQRSLAALEADNLNEIKAIKASKSRAETKHQALLALELDFYRKRAELQMKMIMELQAEQDKYQDEATARIEKELTERLAKETKIRHDAQLVRIYQNDKDAKKELEAKIAAIEEERDVLLKNAHLTEDEVYIIKYEAQKKIDDLEQAYSKKRIDGAILSLIHI